MAKRHHIGVDVGTGSARAGVFSADGRLLASAKCDIRLWQDGLVAEQSSADIWAAVCAALREAVAEAGIDPASVAGLGFDATCSLVVLGAGGRSLPVGPHGDPGRDIIVWMDHRATPQARRINATRHPVLDYVGGTISPEMETPKLLWLKENLPGTWASAWQFFDLADFLGWKATGDLARSACTVTCKWTYLAHENRWDPDYFRQVGLGDLADEGFARIGTRIVAPGQPLGAGLSAAAAAELGLAPGTPVGAGLIDAHAGGLGSVAVEGQGVPRAVGRMAYIFGTSACTMASSEAPVRIPGVWGPYFSAMVPGLWLSEGGQSAAGAAIDQTIALHPAAPAMRDAAAALGRSLPDHLATLAAERGLSEAARLAGRLTVVPDFNGNRAPFADPEARGVIAGLGPDQGPESLIALYVATVLGVGYGLRQIIAASRAKGAAVDLLVLSGGAGRHPVVRQILADCTGVPVAVPHQPEPVLLGAAMLGAAAAGQYPDLAAAMQAMTGGAGIFTPAGGAIATLHDRRFAAFEALQAAQRAHPLTED